MRDTFQREIIKISRKKINAFNCRLGFEYSMSLKKFQKYLNVGVAEQN